MHREEVYKISPGTNKTGNTEGTKVRTKAHELNSVVYTSVESVIMTSLLESMADPDINFIPLGLCHDGVIVASQVPVTDELLSELDNKFIGMYMLIEKTSTEDMFTFDKKPASSSST